MSLIFAMAGRNKRQTTPCAAISTKWLVFAGLVLFVTLLVNVASAEEIIKQAKRSKECSSDDSSRAIKKPKLDRRFHAKKPLDKKRAPTNCPDMKCERVKGPDSKAVKLAFDDWTSTKRSPHTQEKAFDTKNRFLKGQFHKWIPDNISYHFNTDENDGYVGYYMGGKKQGRGIRFAGDKKVYAQYYKNDALFSQRLLEKDQFKKLYKFFEIPCEKKVKFMDEVSDELQFFAGK